MSRFADPIGWRSTRAPGVKMALTLAAVTLAGLWAAGCAEFPEGGPDAHVVIARAAPRAGSDYALVHVTPSVLRTLSAEPAGPLASSFGNPDPPPPLLIGIGDTISITIWDFGGLLSTASGQPPMPAVSGAGASAAAPAPGQSLPVQQSLPVAATSTIPAQMVDQDGNVTVPYAGVIKAAGLSSAALQRAIAVALKPVMIHPQVLVSIGANQSSFVTVAGDVVRPGRVPLMLSGFRLLDVIALSGGGTAPASDIQVRVTRANVTKSERLDDISKSPNENIYMRADDLVVLDREPQSVVVLGATNHNAQIPFGKATLNLAEAVGNGGGLTDIQSDPYGVFVFRYEPATTLRALGVPAPVATANTVNGLTAVVYHINLKDPDGFFMAQAFSMHDHDVIYVANSDFVQIDKMLRLILTGAAIFKSSSIVSN